MLDVEADALDDADDPYDPMEFAEEGTSPPLARLHPRHVIGSPLIATRDYDSSSAI